MGPFLIRSKADIDRFIQAVNGLHDGYLVSVRYDHTGFRWGNPMVCDPTKTRLTLRIMVTSMRNTLVELTFTSVREWQIRERQWDITDTAVSLDGGGFIIWTSDRSTDPEVRKDCDYVVAESMSWSIISEA